LKKTGYGNGIIILLILYLLFQLGRFLIESDRRQETAEELRNPQPAPARIADEPSKEPWQKAVEEAAKKAAMNNDYSIVTKNRPDSIGEFKLVRTGEAAALKGHIVYTPESIVAVELEKGYSPDDPPKPMVPPSNGTFFDLSACKNTDAASTAEFALKPGEEIVALKHGRIGKIPEATAVVAMVKGAENRLMDLQLTPRRLAVFAGNRQVVSASLDADFYPCSLIIDDFDDRPGNEIALIWASIGAGYTMGVTIFALSETGLE